MERKFELLSFELDYLNSIKEPEILFIGDSYFQLWYGKEFKDFSFFNVFDLNKCLNIGIGSTKYSDWLYLIDGIKHFPKFKKIVINLGFNDIHHKEDTTKESVFNDYVNFLNKLRTIFSSAEIYVLTVVVSPLFYSIRNRIEEYNQMVINSKQELNVHIIDNATNIDTANKIDNCFIDDGMHLTYFGHKKMVELIREMLRY